MSKFSIAILLAFVSTNSLRAQDLDTFPNILLIVADDLGYADLGCYGSDISTPNIDALAETGIRFSNYHSGPMCAPTRAMLLTGCDNHVAGMGAQGMTSYSYGYEGHLTERVATIPQVLQEVGYHTYMTGKWHLGDKKRDNPHEKGFEHSFVVKHGAANHYDDQGLFKNAPKSQYTEDGKSAEWPAGAYSTDFYTDKIIEYINRDKDDGRPFFGFIAYTSPHWPLQVDEEFSSKYKGHYDAGYEALREQRLESLKDAGIITPDAVLPPLHESVIPWADLSADEKKKESRKMELYAGMVENLDHNIGRLVAYLRESGLYDKTLIVFVSDNGAAAEDFYYHHAYGPFIRQNFTDAYEDMGQPNSFISYGPQWAEAGSAPFRNFKGYTTEGGLMAPMIISGPGVANEGWIERAFVKVTDLAPTIYAVANTGAPDVYDDVPVNPPNGRSIVRLLDGSSARIHTDREVWAMEHHMNSFVIQGDWKLVHRTENGKDHIFGLYNLAEDPAEINDLQYTETQIYEQLYNYWLQYRHQNQVQFPPPSK